MLAFLFFAAASILCALVTFFLTRRGIFGKWAATLAGVIFRILRGRNRKILLVVFVVIVALAMFEALIPRLHDAMLDMQFAAVDVVGGVEPPGVATYASGGGSSWALYLSILLGTLLGVGLGTYSGCKSSDSTRSVSLTQIF